MKRSSVILLMSAWALSSAHAMTLEDAIGAALNNENQLKISGLNVNQAEAMLQQAKKSNGININLTGQIGVEKIDSTDPGNAFFETEGVRHPRALQLQLDYPIYTSGRKNLGIEVAKMQLKARNKAFSGQEATTILQTVQVYTDVLKQQALLGLKKQVRDNLKKSLSDAQKRFNASVITRADLALVQSQFAQGQADVVLAQSNLDISNAQFVQVTGIQPDQLMTVRRVPTIPNELEQVLQQVANHPMIQQAKFEQQAAEQQYKLTKRELTPTLNVTSRVGKQHEISNFDSNSDNYMVGLQLNVPLFDQGLNRANREKAQVDIRLAQEKIQATQQNLNKQAQATYAQLQAVKQNKQALNEAIDAAALAFNYIQKELEFGTKTTFDALNSEQTLQDLQTQKLLNEQDEVVLVYQLLDQMGLLNNNAKNTTNFNSRANASAYVTEDRSDILTVKQSLPSSNIAQKHASQTTVIEKATTVKPILSESELTVSPSVSHQPTLKPMTLAKTVPSQSSNGSQPMQTQPNLSTEQIASPLTSVKSMELSKQSVWTMLKPNTWFAPKTSTENLAPPKQPLTTFTAPVVVLVPSHREQLATHTLSVEHELASLPKTTLAKPVVLKSNNSSVLKPSTWFAEKSIQQDIAVGQTEKEKQNKSSVWSNVFGLFKKSSKVKSLPQQVLLEHEQPSDLSQMVPYRPKLSEVK